MGRQRRMGWTVALALGALLLAPAMAHAQRRGGGWRGDGVGVGGVNWQPGYGVSYGNFNYSPGYGLNYGNPGLGYGYNQPYGYGQTYGYNPRFGSSGYTVPQWTGQTNPYASGSYNMQPGYNYSMPGTTVMGQQQSGLTQAMYQSGNAPAYVRVIVPSPDAQVFFGETSTQQTGTPVRDFVSPPLEANKEFQYEIRAQWKQGDQTKEEKRTVDVKAGSQVVVNFAQQQGTQPMPHSQHLNQPGTQPGVTDTRDNRGLDTRPPQNRPPENRPPDTQ